MIRKLSSPYRCIVTLMFLLVLFSSGLLGAYLKNVPVKIVQPDGTQLELLAGGDEYIQPLHVSADYTIIKNSKSGNYVYAQLKKDGAGQGRGYVDNVHWSRNAERSYHIRGVDFNSEGNSDILGCNYNTGRVYWWFRSNGIPQTYGSPSGCIYSPLFGQAITITTVPSISSGGKKTPAKPLSCIWRALEKSAANFQSL